MRAGGSAQAACVEYRVQENPAQSMKAGGGKEQEKMRREEDRRGRKRQENAQKNEVCYTGHMALPYPKAHVRRPRPACPPPAIVLVFCCYSRLGGISVQRVQVRARRLLIRGVSERCWFSGRRGCHSGRGASHPPVARWRGRWYAVEMPGRQWQA